MRSVPLADHGVEWIQPPAPLAHPLDDGTGGDARALARGDGVGPRRRTAERGGACSSRSSVHRTSSSPTRSPGPRPPRHPIHMARFGLSARSARRPGLARSRFDGERARALFAGNAAHAMLPLEATATASFGLILAMLGHSVGWPLPRGGSQSIADALASYLRSLGGEIETGRPVDVARRGSRRVSTGSCCSTSRRGSSSRSPATRSPARYRRALEKYRYGPGRRQGRLRALRPGAVARRGVLHAPRPSISAARSTRSPPPRPPSRPAGTPSGRTCSSRSRASSIPPARPAESTRCGPTRTSRTARR